MQFSSKHLATMALALAALAAPGLLAADTAVADLVDTGGAAIGKATFEQTPTGVLMYVEVTGLPPGVHGIHLHAAGSCTPDFKQATATLAPDIPAGLLLVANCDLIRIRRVARRRRSWQQVGYSRAT